MSRKNDTLRTVKENNFHFKKKFGQNFLTDSTVIDDIVSSSNINENDCILEIGPGIGTLTKALADNAGKVIAVEIDDSLIPILQDKLSSYDNIEIINKDILKIDIQELINEKSEGKTIKVVANLPYYITSPIIMGLLESGADIKSITVMVQKEVAERMQSGPGNKQYGALSLAVAYYSKASIVRIVPSASFVPSPKVDSAVIKLDIYDKAPVECKDPKFMFKLIRSSFTQRRKTLLNSLSSTTGIPKDNIREALNELGISEKIRGEALSLQNFADLSDILI